MDNALHISLATGFDQFVGYGVATDEAGCGSHYTGVLNPKDGRQMGLAGATEPEAKLHCVDF